MTIGWWLHHDRTAGAAFTDWLAATAAEIIDIADTVTEMTLIKHAFQAGIPAQRGIED